ncbi:hypothetical protein BGZ67_009769 [Mortierella alpina]|nr:hypothetical protein BGZ67_009769 [Mortierella alpina]
MKLRDSSAKLYNKLWKKALATVSAPCIQDHADDFLKYCPDNIYISMVVAYPMVCGPRLPPVVEVPEKDASGVLQVVIRVSDVNFGQIFPKEHVMFIDRLKNAGKRAADDVDSDNDEDDEDHSSSKAFSVKIQPDDTVDDLKKLIKTEQAPAFDDVTANNLTLWKVSLSIPDDEEETSVILDALSDKKKLPPTNRLSRLFVGPPLEDPIHIIVQRPSPPPHFKPEKKVAFSWCGIVDTATLDDLKKNIFDLYPQYAHDDYLEIFVYNGQPKPELIRDNEDIRKTFKVAKTTSNARLTISLETPSKNFSAWTIKDVCDEYNFSGLSDPGFEVLPPFTDIQSSPLNSAVQDQLISEVESRVDVLPLFGANEATKSMVVASFLVAATALFKEDVYLTSQRNLSGRRGNGPVDFSI